MAGSKIFLISHLFRETIYGVIQQSPTWPSQKILPELIWHSSTTIKVGCCGLQFGYRWFLSSHRHCLNIATWGLWSFYYFSFAGTKVILGNIHILRKYLYSTKLHLTTYLIFHKNYFFFRRNKLTFWQHFYAVVWKF